MSVSTPAAPPGFELVQPIGHGASIIVWRAVQLSMRRAVALKIVDADVSHAPKPQVEKNDDSESCATAIREGLRLVDNQQRNAGGPDFTSSACMAIDKKLTSATYLTYARSCLETSSGSAITSCSSWKLRSYPDTWDTLSTDVPGGTRWQIQIYRTGPQRVGFSYTA